MFSLSLDVECLVFNDFPDIIVTPFMEEDAGLVPFMVNINSDWDLGLCPFIPMKKNLQFLVRGNLIWKAFAILGHCYDQVLLLAIRIMQVSDTPT
ncbi:hypothetical protein TSUD_381510 [Trifolium subterraneum]|uniref:Uncharacterized protein n=1 Tax=Trifolium subterraneum TaxID=3900 RepID=A0A2Z6LP34_TRISU|nr:hypothetical protein TSUD_381510 [Trifolium subterraneum]